MIDLSFNHVTKLYRIRQGAEANEARNTIARSLKNLWRRSAKFLALNDVSFEVARGEALGIIGHNGAGKSTILKLLSKITAPTSGEIMINGKLAALIEVGSGFHPELTGRENVYLSGSILGMRRREIAKKLDSIIDFAGVRQFIDTPVKRYSSGMYVRLGFSIAAHLHPDILLLDEVLAVGDASFQAKCFGRINELKRNGTTTVFISHDLRAVEALCARALLLDRGKIVADGDTRDVIAQYERVTSDASLPHASQAGMQDSSKPARIAGVVFKDYEDHDTSMATTGSPLVTQIEYSSNRHISDVIFEVFYYSQDGRLQCQYSTALGCEQIDLDKGTGAVEFACAELGLQPGFYYADAVIKRRADGEEIDWQARCAVLRVEPGKSVLGNFYVPHDWRVIRHKDVVAIGPQADYEARSNSSINASK